MAAGTDDRAGDALRDAAEIVRRVVATRIRDPQLVEDLTQETLVRVASARDRLDDESLRPYAIVTARNVVAEHGRSEAVHGRHLHRLVEHHGDDGPEQTALVREETDALAAALEQLDVDERTLLLRHEAEGIDLNTLAEESGSSRGAIAMRLARARALLRLEFVLALRKVSLPSNRCRAVLVALSAGDGRRVDRLDGEQHLEGCDTCRALAEPVSERKRSLAGWLILPAVEAVRRAATSIVSSKPARALRSNHAAQLGAAAAAVVASVVAAVIIVSSNGDPAEVAERAPVTAAATRPAVTAALAQPPATSRPRDRCAEPVQLDATPGDQVGCPFAGAGLVVHDVPADEGFWARLRGGRGLVWVRLVGEGESPVDVIDRARLVVSGTIEAPPSTPGALGLDADGLDRVERRGYYLEVRFTDIRPR